MSEDNNITTNDETEAPAPDMPEQASEGATLGVADLQNAAQVIDIAVSRGAFRAGEAAQVGTVFNRLTAFIKQVDQAQQQNAPAETEAAASE
tara:strand:- start:401 stop:676 length:276 start_codon:yes stop_codon:yes gene_type:complete